MSQDKLDAAEPSIKCPKAEWVQAPLMKEYLEMVQNPAVSVEVENKGRYGWDWYTMQVNGGPKLQVDVNHGEDPRDKDSVLVLADDKHNRADHYQKGQRVKAQFEAIDNGERIGNGLALITDRDEKAFVSEESGGLNDSQGRNTFFVAHFDRNGDLIDFSTLKPDPYGYGYTPATCEK